ncbi:hypothetical protein [Oerskovia sp. KBS0722]|uniref:hypothetical protein n=1 Tax=Oerskovia sp. KBS0722 TaxID=1179673 RepID=UPI00110D2770|nr:hypothetical protein [Oerskovia sp. KBS0722]QDW61819.1 hypothetical protein FFI11_004160 [Oerskovia sp. KBS0722]
MHAAAPAPTTIDLPLWVDGRKKMRLTAAVSPFLAAALLTVIAFLRFGDEESFVLFLVIALVAVLAIILPFLVYWVREAKPVAVDLAARTLRIGDGPARPFADVTYAYTRIEQGSLTLRFGFSETERTAILRNLTQVVSFRLPEADARALMEVFSGSSLPEESTATKAFMAQKVLLGKADAIEVVAALAQLPRIA